MWRNYLLQTWRSFHRHRDYMAIHLLSMIAGLTAFILIAAFVRQEMHYDRFHLHADRIYRVVQVDPAQPGEGQARTGAPWAPALAADFPDIESYSRVLQVGRVPVRYGIESHYESGGILADSTFFQVFSFPLLQGDPQSALSRPFNVVVSESFAHRYFGEDNPIGKVLRIEQEDRYTVTGVMADVAATSHLQFDYIASFDSHDAWFKTEWGINNYLTYLQLRPGADPAALEAKLPAFLAPHRDPEATDRLTAHLQPLTDIHLHSNYQQEFGPNGSWQVVLILSAIGLLILLIACVNFTNIATAQAGRRAREIGVRKVAGARWRQLVVQFMSESVVLCLFAFLGAAVLAEVALPYFNQMNGLNLSLRYRQDLPFSGFLLGVALLTGLLAGAYPALYLARMRPLQALKNEEAPRASGGWFRQGLLVFQFAASIAMLICAGVIYQQLRYTLTRDLGFDRSAMLVLRMPDREVAQRFVAARDRLLSRPGILGIAASSGDIGGGDWGMPLGYEGGGTDRLDTRVMAVDEHYIPAYGMTMVRGRNFSADMGTDQTAFILNETAARQLGWADPVGKYLERPAGRNAAGEWTYVRGPVVGVVRDYHFRSLHQAIDPMVLFWEPNYISYYFVKLQPDRRIELLDYLEKEWTALSPDYPFDYAFLDQTLAGMYGAERNLEHLVQSFTLLALLVACLGLFGLSAYQMQRQTKEVGIRKILGAPMGSLLMKYSRTFLALVGIAFLAAAPVSWWLMNRWLDNFAYRTGIEPWTFLSAGALAVLVAGLTVGYQVWRVARANPVNALRQE